MYLITKHHSLWLWNTMDPALIKVINSYSKWIGCISKWNKIQQVYHNRKHYRRQRIRLAQHHAIIKVSIDSSSQIHPEISQVIVVAVEKEWKNIAILIWWDNTFHTEELSSQENSLLKLILAIFYTYCNFPM